MKPDSPQRPSDVHGGLACAGLAVVVAVSSLAGAMPGDHQLRAPRRDVTTASEDTPNPTTMAPEVSTADQKQKEQKPRNDERALLAEKDFTFVGTYTADRRFAEQQGGGEVNFGLGFTHRYVGDELRFLTLGYNSDRFRLVEFTAPAKLGGEVKSPTNVWPDVWQNDHNRNDRWHGLWWDEGKSRLWTTHGIDYPDDKNINSTKSLMTRKLEKEGKVSDVRGSGGCRRSGHGGSPAA
jgi:hypothetical protein